MNRLAETQKQIKKEKLDALIVDRNDMFLGQDITDEDNHILRLTGFSGSNAKLMISSKSCFLLTDTRYEIQVKNEVDIKKIKVFTSPQKFHNATFKLIKNKESKIGYNAWTTSINELEKLKKQEANYVQSNIINCFPSQKENDLFELGVEFVGLSRKEKIQIVVKHLKKNGLKAFLFTAADSVSWLSNLRSNYIRTSPTIRAFALVDSKGKLTMFGDYLEHEEINFQPLEKLKNFIKDDLYCDFETTPAKILDIANENKVELIDFVDICKILKVEKNETELKNMAKSHIKDGVAVTKFLYWLEKNWKNQTEISIVEKLYEFRKKEKLFLSNSFKTISGFAEHGAIVHYHPTLESNKKFEKNSLLLLDSGAHYMGGTTDITRTIPIGKPSSQMKKDYTIVLKSHIALASLSFPDNTLGIELNAVAKKVMWQFGKDYAHGTGHGIGFVTNVHEGPQGISSKGGYVFAENMLTSIEPGYYIEGEYGIRLENIYKVIKSKYKKMLTFEALTLVPFDKKLIDFDLLEKNELNWLEKYQQTTYKKISPYLNSDEKSWLKSFIKI